MREEMLHERRETDKNMKERIDNKADCEKEIAKREMVGKVGKKDVGGGKASHKKSAFRRERDKRETECGGQAQEKTLYMNGRILTMDDAGNAKESAQAVLVSGGRVEAVGTDEALRAMAGGGARIVNLAGRTLCPAFIDAHSHFMAVAHSMLQVDLSEAQSLEDMSLAIGRYIASRRIVPGNFVLCRGYDAEERGGYPPIEALDALAPGYALVIQHPSGHAGMVNTLALEKLGITPDTRDPQGGRIGREGDRLTGYLEENAFLLAQRAFPVPQMEEIVRAMQDAQMLYAAHGIATVQEGLLLSSMLPMYREVLERGLLTLDVVGYPSPQDYGAFAEAFPRSMEGYDRRFRLGGIKILLDGSPQARTAFLSAPYEGEKAYRGYPSMTPEQTVEAIRYADKLGVQLLAHCNGDAAAQQLIDACKKAQKQGADLARIRPVMIHAQLLRADQMSELAALHITPSFFVAHVFHWGEIHAGNLGQERASRISALASAERSGLPFTLHQDAPVIKPDMLETLWVACERRTRHGVQLGAQECVSIDTALRAVTVNAARQYGEAGKGVIRPGMRADFVILSGDPLGTPVSELRSLRVEETVREGQTIWSRDASMPSKESVPTAKN